MSFLTSMAHDAIRSKIRIVIEILLSLLALTWLLGWLGMASDLGFQGWSPSAAMRWALRGAGYSDPDWLNVALTWLHDPSRRSLLRLVAFAAGLAASGTALRWGPLRGGVGPGVAWALLLAAIEGLGSGHAIRLAMLGFAVPIACALVAWLASWPWIPDSRRSVPRQWSLGGIGNALANNLIQFMMLPALVPMLVSWIVVAYRDDGGSEPSGPRMDATTSRGLDMPTAADAEDRVTGRQAAAHYR
jgi:hypothetical protein